MNTRLHRLRGNSALRDLVRENRLSINDMVLPLFVTDNQKEKKIIHSMPSHYQHTLDTLDREIEEIQRLNIPAVILFGIPNHKDENGSAAFENSIISKAIARIKKKAPELLIISDLCLCEYTTHGHCGVLKTDNRYGYRIDNDITLDLLAKQALHLAEAGSDVIAPSAMMDGMVSAVRSELDKKNFQHIPILSYSVKYASAFYRPFREAANGAPQMGDRKTYQMDIANSNEALREASLDVQEGADMLVIKPSYLDIIYRIKQAFPEIPLAAYQVSGEFAMIKAAAKNGWIDEQQAMIESLTNIKRAGADFIITYFAKDFATRLINQD